jgi:RNA polymerase sporulation-specific sigma factor
MTQKEVADLLGISQSYISRLEKKIIAKLKDELEQVLGCFQNGWLDKCWAA